MTSRVTLTKDNMKKLVCGTCNGYLSFPPIFMNEGKFICGRCTPQGYRNTIYEELAEFMTFQCTFKQCTVKLKWSEAQKHESNCKFKTVMCPKHNCNHIVMAQDFYQHAMSLHSNLFQTNNFTITRRLRDMDYELFNDDLKVYFINHQNQTYIAMVYGTCKEDRYNPNDIYMYHYYFDVFYVYKDNSTCTKYDLKVSLEDSEGEINEHNFIAEEIQEYIPNRNCLGCLANICRKGHAQKPKKILRKKLPNVKNTGDLILTYSINIISNPVPVRFQNSPKSPLAEKLECPICFEYFTAQIFICQNGHSVCADCKKRMTKCALCKATFGNSRNRTLEDLIETVEVCCHNASKGCNYVSNIINVRNHSVICRFK